MQDQTMGSVAAAGGPLAWAVDLFGSRVVASAASGPDDASDVHVLTLTVTAFVAILALLASRALRSETRRSAAWRTVARSALLLNIVFVVTIATTTLVRLVSS